MPISEVTNEDCINMMERFPDNFFDIAICDPPYGIGFDGQRVSTSSHGGRKAHDFKGWDKRPDPEYWTSLWRVSKNQIIWGANYFTKHLPPSMGWIFWDKGQRICNSDGELAFTSFDRALRVVEYNRVELFKEGTIHPTQKPKVLYKWVYDNYATKGDKILDTHLGSQSNRIVAYHLKFDFWATELNPEYFKEGNERFAREISEPLFSTIPEPAQTKLFL